MARQTHCLSATDEVNSVELDIGTGILTDDLHYLGDMLVGCRWRMGFVLIARVSAVWKKLHEYCANWKELG